MSYATAVGEGIIYMQPPYIFTINNLNKRDSKTGIHPVSSAPTELA